jgi:hypothetical protein
LGHGNYITETHRFLGSVEMDMGRYEESRKQVRTSLELVRTHRPPYCIGLNLFLLGYLALADGAHVQAHQSLCEGVEALREIGGHQDERSWAQASLALAVQGLGDTAKAREYLCHALQSAAASRAVLPLLWTLVAAALLLADEGEAKRAVELYALVSRYPLVVQSRWFAEGVGRRITAAASRLSAGQIAALQERGRARDPDTTVADILSDRCN